MPHTTARALRGLALALGRAAFGGCHAEIAPTAATSQSVAQTLCAYDQSCFAPLLYGVAPDLAGCVASTEANLARKLSLPGVTATLADYARCAAALDPIACNADALDVCPLAPGALPDGASCESELQCAGGQCGFGSDSPGFPDCGTCEKPEVIPLGNACAGDGKCSDGTICLAGKLAPCTADGAPCATDGECVHGDLCAAGTCTKPKGLGAACDATAARCAPRLTCDATTHTCQPKGALGAPCSGAADCDELRGTTCDATAGKCVLEAVTMTPVGGACDAGLIPVTFSPCASGSICVNSTPTGSAGTCVPLVDVGAACGVRVAECKAGLRCTSGKCSAMTVCK